MEMQLHPFPDRYVTCRQVNLSSGENRNHILMPAPESGWWRRESEITSQPLPGAWHPRTLSSLGVKGPQALGAYSERVPGSG